MAGNFQDMLRTAKRVHFWVLCPLVVLLGLIAWLLATSSLKRETAANSSKIGQLYQTLSQVSSKDRHANDQVSEGMDRLIGERRKEVAAAWAERWNQQTGILTWPKGLDQKLVERVEGLRPIERHVPFPVPPEKEIAATLRRNYRDYIKDELPKLAEQIGAKWDPSGSAARGEGMYPPEGERGMRRRGREGRQDGESIDRSIVKWDSANQLQIEQNHFDWSGSRQSARDGAFGGTGDGVPSLLEVLYAQEDLWVLRSIISVIEKANEGAATRFNAAVKEIHSIDIGRNAAGSQGRITRPSGAAAGTADQMLDAPYGEPGPREPGAREPGIREGEYSFDGEGYGDAMMAPQDDPADRRYVDRDYKPLPASELREVMSPDHVPQPEKAYLAVAKRMPVRMRLRVDQRRLNQLLAECAGAELTIEVRQVRVNPDSATGPSGFPGRGGSLRERAYGEAGMTMGAEPRKGEELFQFDVDVELYGIVYIYNPVDKQVLGSADEPEEDAVAEADAAADV